MNKKIRAIGALVLVVIWAALVGFAWFGPAKDSSESERRPLKQWPGITGESLWNGSFMGDFEDYTLDQFPLRDTFREIKSIFHYYGLHQSDNNSIYLHNGYAAKMEYPLNQVSLNHATDRFTFIYEKFLKDSGCKAYMAAVPDKGYYMAEGSGHLSMDYEDMFRFLREKMPWATYVDLTDSLTLEDYYRTDTHWRQEKILKAAQKLSEALGVTPPRAEDFTAETLERPFYGVYYGQAALPMDPEQITILHSDVLDACKVFDQETGGYTDVYNMDKLTSKDLYDVYLSGARAMLTIENPNATTDRELIIFRDSFASSMSPLLVQDYAKVTLVDIRYINSAMLDQFITFDGQDVLFLYSTLVLNSSTTLK